MSARLDAHAYEVVSAVELPRDAVEGLAQETAWVKGFRMGTKVPLLTVSARSTSAPA